MSTMTDHESPIIDTNGSESRNGHVNAMRWTIALLSLAVVGLVGFIVLSDDGNEAMTPEQDQMIETVDTYLAGWNAGDEEAVLAVMDPLGYYDNGEQWRVDDGRLAGYVRTLHSLGMNVARGETVVLGNVVVAMQTTYGESGDYTSIYKMSPDGTTILWNRT